MFTTQDLIKGIKAEIKSLVKFTLHEMKSQDDYWDRQQKHREYLEAVRAYQVANNISGLVAEEFKLGDRSISFHRSYDPLAILDPDMEILAAEKEGVIDFFLETVNDGYCDLLADICLSDPTEIPTLSSLDELKKSASAADYAFLSYTKGWFPKDGGTLMPIGFTDWKYYAHIDLSLKFGRPGTCLTADECNETQTFQRFNKKKSLSFNDALDMVVTECVKFAADYPLQACVNVAWDLTALMFKEEDEFLKGVQKATRNPKDLRYKIWKLALGVYGIDMFFTGFSMLQDYGGDTPELREKIAKMRRTGLSERIDGATLDYEKEQQGYV